MILIYVIYLKHLAWVFVISGTEVHSGESYLEYTQTFPAQTSRSDEQSFFCLSRDTQCKYLNGGYGNSQHAL